MATLQLQTLDNRLHGRLALVTGSRLATPVANRAEQSLTTCTNSGGIGSACAKALAAEGCDVVLHYSSSKVSIIARRGVKPACN